jgi:hypothetical protein
MAPKFSRFSEFCQETTSGFRQQVFVMFHSTPSWKSAASILEHGFHLSGPNRMLGEGVYVSSTLRKAEAYGAYTFKLLVYPGKICMIDHQGHPMQKSWQRQFESAWVPPNCGMVPSGLQVSANNMRLFQTFV